MNHSPIHRWPKVVADLFPCAYVISKSPCPPIKKKRKKVSVLRGVIRRGKTEVESLMRHRKLTCQAAERENQPLVCIPQRDLSRCCLECAEFQIALCQQLLRIHQCTVSNTV
ncbi:hypothetical protein CEXT_440601 [Caerostris extrusa]|uniref:Uncharacterized protein n=1 Tax=Caerostris extrusa TaxID=172846 RepID=A0AAV4RF72_CAEEX|nr:hypothetical protein CEXT_440601 [Caerostris extrusa]